MASSAAVYGEQDREVSEDTPLSSNSPYGLSKRMAEEYVRLLGRRWDIPWLILRYANVYGPYPLDSAPKGVCRIFAQNLAKKENLNIHGLGTQIRDFVSVYDVAQANFLACRSQVSQECLNIASGQGNSILDVVEILKEVSGRDPLLRFEHQETTGVAFSKISANKAKKILNWIPRWTLRDGLDDLWQNSLRYRISSDI